MPMLNQCARSGWRAALKPTCCDRYRSDICVVAKSTSWDLACSPALLLEKRQISGKQPSLVASCTCSCTCSASALADLQTNQSFCFFDDDNKEQSFTHHWSVHVPESSLLTVENLPLNLVPFLVHSREEQKSRAVWAELIPARYEPPAVQQAAGASASHTNLLCLCFCLHKNKLPFPGEGALKPC